MLDKSIEPSKYDRAEWVWTCELRAGKLIRDHVEVDEIDAQGRITHLANGKRLAFVKVSGYNYDSYRLLGSDDKILVERSIKRHILPQAPSVEKESSDFNWD